MRKQEPAAKELADNFTEDRLISLFRQKNESFRPDGSYCEEYLEEKEEFSEHFEDFKRLGEIEYSPEDRLIILTGRTKQDLSERTSKKRQFELAKKFLKQEDYDAGIFVFFDSKGRFRFSLITARYEGKKRTFGTWRRYTFFVCPDSPNKTFVQQIGRADFSSIDNIREAFSIEAVSEQFYNEFSPKFNELIQSVTDTDDDTIKRDFALLFVIRIIFLGFVQKRGWLGGQADFIKNYFAEYRQHCQQKDTFYTRWLEPLFFEALNDQPGSPVSPGNNEFSKETEKTLKMAPYLNGEIFKPKHGVDDIGLSLPDDIIAEFLDFLFQYNFTIEENYWFDEELELNPEFLGIIFERLVNKENGAVYTPRVEVDLMCRMGLVNWLEKNSSSDYKDLYHLMFREAGFEKEYEEHQKHGDFSAKEIREISELLDKVTICDPAAGSGAFEVGMLQVLFELKKKLYQRDNCPEELVETEDYKIKKGIIAKSLYGVEVKNSAVWINQLRLWLTLFIDMPEKYRNSLKPLLPSLNFKVRCGDSLVQRIGGKIFPVHGHADIESASIKKKITKLKKEKIDFFYNQGEDATYIRKLENDVFREIIQNEIKEKEKQLIKARRTVHTDRSLLPDDQEAGDIDNKRIISKKKKNIPVLEADIKELREELDKLRNEHPLVWNIEFAEIFYDKNGFDIIIGNPPYVRQEDIADPYQNVESQVYKKLLKESIRTDYPIYFKEKTRKISGKSDLYTYFYLKSLNLLNSKGTHVFICSNSWLDVGYGVWMQEFLLSRVPMNYVIDNHSKRSFASSDINTVITIFDAPVKTADEDFVVKFVAFKKPFEQTVLTENLLEIRDTKDILKRDDFRVYPITVAKLWKAGIEYQQKKKKTEEKYIGDKWGGKYLRAPDIFFTILEKGKDKLVKLKDVADVRFGIKTGCNEFFYLTKQQAEKWGIEEEFLKPVIKSPRESKGVVINPDELQFQIFICNKTKKELKGTNALKYIEWGEKENYHKRSTLQGRKPWWCLPDKKPRQILWPMIHNTRLGAFVNRDEVCVDHNLFEIEANFFPISIFSSLIILSRELLGRSNLGQGALKTEGIDIKQFIVLKEYNCSSNYYEILSDYNPKPIFEECGVDPESEVLIEQQEPQPLADRKELDDIVFDALGLTEDERKDVYRAVCRLVWNRISKAKSVKKRK